MANPSGEWVEIIEPQSKERMFANPTTGEILLTPPEGVTVKPMSQNQWWELYDTSSDSYYYYNAHTGDTVWEKPGNDADIIPLTKLQSVEPESEQTLEPVAEEPEGATPAGTANVVEQQPETVQPITQDHVEPPQHDISDVQPQRVERKLSEILSDNIEPMSPLTIDYQGQRFSSFSNNTADPSNPTVHAQAAATRGEMSQFNKSRTLDGSKRYVECAHGVRDSWVDIQVVKQAGGAVNGEGGVRRGNGVDDRGSYLEPRAGGFTGGSLDRSGRGRDQYGGSTYDKKSRTLDTRRGTTRDNKPNYTPARPAPTPPMSKSSEAKSKSPAHKRTSIQYEKSKSVDLTSPEHKKVKQKKTHSRAKSSDIPPVPAPPPLMTSGRSHSASTKAGLESFKELATHRKGFFRKKVTIANMLCWTKDPIKQPMIQCRDKQQKKDACEAFKLLLQYMGDRKTKQKDVNLIALDITSQAWEKKGLRDEMYIQLCRQTSSNSNPKSLQRGWEMFAICLAFFPPSFKFRTYLEGYLWRHVDPSPEYKGIPVEVFAQYCHKRVEKMAQSGAKKGVKKPTVEEIIHAKQAPFNPSMFGTTLEDTIQLQREKFPSFDQSLPWVVSALTDAVVQLKGPRTEGIFRVPGDIDEVNSLKLQIDKGLVPMNKLTDPHVPASLLKLWFRELEDPLIPQEYYDECIKNCDNEANALSLVDSLPEQNKQLLFYLVGFLKQFITPESTEATKMGLDNISMVWAPNFLRCPSDDHTLIFQNTRKEMAFLRVLLRLLDTHPPATASSL